MVVGKDGKVVRKNVVTEGQQGSNWLVTAGLEPGDKVVVAGVQKVKEGAPATAKPWSPEQAAAGQGAPAAGQKPAAQGDAAADAATPDAAAQAPAAADQAAPASDSTKQ